MYEKTPWEQEELDNWRRPRPRSWVRPPAPYKDEPIRYVGPFRHNVWQWLVIFAVTVPAVLNYLEIITIYHLYAVGGLEFLSRVLFADLIAYSQNEKRDVPLVWWILAYFSPPATFLYLYFFSVDKSMRKRVRLKYDAGFAVVCVLYLIFDLLVLRGR
jgi:hypothetical protein